MKAQIRLGKNVVTYSITKTKRKTSAIIVDVNGVEVKTPLTKDDAETIDMVLSKKKWIIQKQIEFNNSSKQIATTTKTVEYLKNRTQKLANKLGVKPHKIVIKSMKTRWGSSSKAGVITLNNAISNAPLKVIDYVIIHELCHLKIRDHSKKFWNMVHTYAKNFESEKKWLEKNAHLLLEGHTEKKPVDFASQNRPRQPTAHCFGAEFKW